MNDPTSSLLLFSSWSVLFSSSTNFPPLPLLYPFSTFYRACLHSLDSEIESQAEEVLQYIQILFSESDSGL